MTAHLPQIYVRQIDRNAADADPLTRLDDDTLVARFCFAIDARCPVRM